MISDMFVCLFEQDGWTKSNLTLIFWANLKALVTIRKNIVGNTIRLCFKQKKKKDNHIIELDCDHTNEILDLILDKMGKFGINYKISKQTNAPKNGIVPKIDIESVENAISDMERKIGNTIEQADIEYLMDLYSKVIFN